MQLEQLLDYVVVQVIQPLKQGKHFFVKLSNTNAPEQFVQFIDDTLHVIHCELH